jgi:hypothetical protein
VRECDSEGQHCACPSCAPHYGTVVGRQHCFIARVHAIGVTAMAFSGVGGEVALDRQANSCWRATVPMGVWRRTRHWVAESESVLHAWARSLSGAFCLILVPIMHLLMIGTARARLTLQVPHPMADHHGPPGIGHWGAEAHRLTNINRWLTSHVGTGMRVCIVPGITITAVHCQVHVQPTPIVPAACQAAGCVSRTRRGAGRTRVNVQVSQPPVAPGDEIWTVVTASGIKPECQLSPPLWRPPFTPKDMHGALACSAASFVLHAQTSHCTAFSQCTLAGSINGAVG